MAEEEEGLKNALHFPFEGWWKKATERKPEILGSHSAAITSAVGSEGKSAEKWNEIEVKSITGG